LKRKTNREFRQTEGPEQIGGKEQAGGFEAVMAKGAQQAEDGIA
jgi:hypothetical protein